MIENRFCLNAGKTKLIIAGTSARLQRLDRRKIDVKMNGEKLKPIDNEKLLGCHINAPLKWTTQIIELTKKLKKRLAALGMIKNMAPLNIRKTIYEGIFNSVLTYCIVLWGGLNKSDNEDLQVLQN